MERSIIVEHLVKDFIVTKKEQGLLANLSSLVSPQKVVINALKDINFSLKTGELVGFIGPNGAGKTTTLKILSGILYPTSGFVSVAGFTPWERNPRYLKKIAMVMGQKNQLWWDLPAIETLNLNKAIYEIPKAKFKRNLEELTNLLEVEDLLTIQVRRLSLGQRMRLELVAALVHEPEIVFLDEPTIGLDVVGQQKVRDFLVNYNKKHEATIVLTSHNMDDVLNLAKRVIVINEGRIIFDGGLSELISQYAKEKTIKVRMEGNIDYKKLENIGRLVKLEIPEVEIAVPRNISAIAAAEILQSFPVVDLTIEEESIDSIIRQVFKGPKKTKRQK